MGRTHALTGVLAGLLTGRLVGLDTIAQLLPYAAVTAGYTLAPDLDHPGATASRLLGPVTGWISRGVRALSRGLYTLTKGPRDEDIEGTHRHLTHTLLFALALGGLCAVTTAIGGHWAVAGWLALGLLLASDRLGVRFGLAAVAVSAAAWLPAVLSGRQSPGDAMLAALDATTGWLGVAVATGCAVHCLGDALTESGCPFLFPLPIAGETWYELRPPAWLRFHTGKRVERFVIVPLVTAGCLAALPGLLPHLIALFTPPAALGTS